MNIYLRGDIWWISHNYFDVREGKEIRIRESTRFKSEKAAIKYAENRELDFAVREAFCRSCKQVKNKKDFVKGKFNSSGTRGICNGCNNEKNRTYAKSHPHYMRDRQRVYHIENPVLTLWKGARTRAKKKGLEFDIEIEDIIIPEKCPVFGEMFSIGEGKSPWNLSLDRIDPTYGYIKGNIWVISYCANSFKQDATPSELHRVSEAAQQELSHISIFGPRIIVKRELSKKERERFTKKRRRCDIDNIPFNLTEEDFQCPIKCPIFGHEFVFHSGPGRVPKEASLDRIDPSRGYIKGNVWWISHRANTIKGNATPDQLRCLAQAVHKRLALKQVEDITA